MKEDRDRKERRGRGEKEREEKEDWEKERGKERHYKMELVERGREREYRVAEKEERGRECRSGLLNYYTHNPVFR